MAKKEKKILVLLDMHAILHRAFHALPAFSSPKGEPTGALYGFAAFLLKVLRELKPDYIAAAFDLPEPTFRHAAYEKYKAQRPEMASDLSSQIERSYEILKAFSIPAYEHPRYEADDIIGTLVEKTKKNKELEIIIASGDLDTLQLVEGSRVRVFTLKKGIQDTVLYTAQAVKERFGFSPRLLPDFKGLRGDPSDNIPGVPGIGEKGAADLIQKFGSLENIFRILKKDKKAFAKAGIKERTMKLLGEHEEEAFFSKTLAMIRKDAPLAFELEELRWRRKYERRKGEALFKELGFLSLMPRLPDDETPQEKEQTLLIEERPDFLEKEKKLWWLVSDSEKKIYLVSQQRKLFGFSPDEYPSHQEMILRPGKEHYFFDAKKIFHVLASSGKAVRPLPRIADDLKISAWLLNSRLQNPSLNDVVHTFMPKERIEQNDILKTALLLPRLSEILEKRIRENNLKKVLSEIELPLIPILYEMEQRGMVINKKYLLDLSQKYEKKLELLLEKIRKLAGVSFNVNSPIQLGEVLFEKLKLQVKGLRKTAGGARSTRESELIKLKHLHPIVSEILAYRELAKLKSTYIDPLPGLADSRNRIHSSFEQTGTVTGRLSSSEPNLQNIPIRSDAGREIRRAFEAPPGFLFVSFDYSQLELRIAALMSGDEKMKRAFQEGKDIHALTAAEVFNVPEAKVTPEMRRRAKVINFGILYGMGISALSQGLQTSREEAEAFWEEYFRDFEGVARFLEELKERARTHGYGETLFGRRRFLPEIYSEAEFLRKEAERMAINAPIQGTGADMVKLGMIRSEEFIEKENLQEKAFLILQIHDELLFEVKSEILSKFVPPVKAVLEGIYESDVPFTVEVKTGLHLGEIKKYEVDKKT